MKMRLVKQVGAANDDPVVTEEEPAHGGDSRNQPDVGCVEAGFGLGGGCGRVVSCNHRFNFAQSIVPLSPPLKQLCILLPCDSDRRIVDMGDGATVG